ncbi:MAG: TolC family protein [Chitinispirillaceae bacterium]
MNGRYFEFLRGLVFILCAVFCALGQTLTLEQCERKALEQNFSLNASRYERNAVKWRKYSTVGTILPTVTLNTNWLQTQTPQISPGQQPSPGQAPSTGATFTQDGFHHQLTVTQPIFNGGGEVVSYLLAASNLAASDFKLDAACQDAILQVRNAYFNTLLLSEQIKIDSMGLEWTRRNLHQARIRHEEGVLPPAELLRWKAEVADRRGRVIDSYASYQASLGQLLLTVGEPLELSSAVQLEDASFLEELFEKTSELPQGTSEDNPEIKAAKEELNSLNQTTFLRLTRFLPNINAFAQYDWPVQDELFAREEGFWTYGIRVNWTLFSGAKRFSDYYASKNQYLQLESQMRQLSEQNRISLFQARTLYLASRERVNSARTRLELMERSLSMMEQRYEAGLVSMSDLLDTRIQTDSAHIAYLRSLTEAVIQESEYRAAVGLLGD